MTDSDSDANFDIVNPYIFYKDRDEWKDVQPIPQNDGPHAIVKIAYSEKFSDIFDYFRAVYQKEEFSDRALSLTKDAIKQNPANYTVWQYRRKILKAMNKDLRDELKYLNDVILDNPKNYQVWFHRQAVVEWLNDPSEEKDFIDAALREDSKNYHAWQYRHWLNKKFSLWDGELKFTENMIRNDVRNNSAWNHRYYVINSTTGFNPVVLDREEKLTMSFIEKAPSNESPWSYLRGLHLVEPIHKRPGLKNFCTRLAKENTNMHILSFMVDINSSSLEETFDTTIYDETLRLLDELASLDTIRRKYWKFIKDSLIKKFEDGTIN
ncbi:DgyrCDS13781 [Dimorphilus gyrociliatus]|uniref:Protein farnesyltransferase/geranylgeranyltransferase type-1 subunit alpha n=1 Tax=Dimorphilus gyrociliatus TaxID=2664684 RepID=A0A7I8WBT1_9ANNE|nr:DgyrCDS13781 [Dimorphilus gyrociliatus]